MSKIGDLRQALLKLLQEHEHDGAIPTSARFLYYGTDGAECETLSGVY